MEPRFTLVVNAEGVRLYDPDTGRQVGLYDSDREVLYYVSRTMDRFKVGDMPAHRFNHNLANAMLMKLYRRDEDHWAKLHGPKPETTMESIVNAALRGMEQLQALMDAGILDLDDVEIVTECLRYGDTESAREFLETALETALATGEMEL